jgi:hypothetical protein
LVSNPGLPPAQRAENGSDGASHAIYAVSSIINPYHSFPNNLEIWNGLLFGGYGAYLPANNSDFGRKGVTMTFGGGNVHTANIEVFYPATGKRHPSGGPPAWGGSTPNYIYYYAQIYPSPDVVYTPFGTSHYNLGENVIWIADNYASEPYPVRLFEMGPGGFIVHDSGAGVEGIGARDRLFVRGIHSYIYNVGHERGHRNDYNTLFNGQRVLDTAGRAGDADGDGLLDVWEELHGFDPTDPDTANAYGGNGDDQASADIQGYGALRATGVKELWQLDWAYWSDPDNCMQYGNPYGQWRPFRQFYDSTMGKMVDLLRLKPIPWEYEAWGAPAWNTDTTVPPPGKNYLTVR